MHRTKLNPRRMIAGLAIVAGLMGGNAQAQQQPATPKADVTIDAKSGALIAPVGLERQLTLPTTKPVFDVFVRDNQYLKVDFDPKNPNVLFLTGLAPGFTQISLTYEDGSKTVYEVVVQPDLEFLKSIIRRAVPTANVELIPGQGDAIILSGYVSKPEDADIVLKIVSDARGGNLQSIINAIQIGGAQQVLIDVVIAQVDRSKIRQRGFNFGVQGSTFGISSILDGLAGRAVGVAGGAGGGANVGGLGTTGLLTPTSAANIAVGIVPAGTVLALRALQSENLAKFLSEPKVITQSGRPAFLRSGGQQAVLGPNSGLGGISVVQVQTGTNLEVLPIVLGNGDIYLEVNPQVVTVNNGLGLQTTAGFTPGFNEQQTRSSVTLKSGQTFAIGGLNETSIQGTASKVPVLGELPIIGTVFSSVTYSQRETELIVLVTPRLVGAMDCAQVPGRIPGLETRAPDDYELFLEQLLEAPRGQRKVWNGDCFVPAYRCDPTAAQFPCQGNVCVGGVGAGSNCANGNCAAPTEILTSGSTTMPAPVAPIMPYEPEPLPMVPGGSQY